MNHHNIELLFKSGIGPDIFGATMSQQRMKFLLAHITFDDKSTCKDWWPSDRFAAWRDIFEIFNKNCSKYVIPSEYLAINETLYPMRHQMAFRQYNKKKPHKYGLALTSISHPRFLFYLQSCFLFRQTRWWRSLLYMLNGRLCKVISEWSWKNYKSQRT